MQKAASPSSVSRLILPIFVEAVSSEQEVSKSMVNKSIETIIFFMDKYRAVTLVKAFPFPIPMCVLYHTFFAQ